MTRPNKIALFVGLPFLLLVVALVVVAIVRSEKPVEGLADVEPLVLCLVDLPPTAHLQRRVDKLEVRWKGLVEVVSESAPCDADLRFSDEESPIEQGDYAPGIAVSGTGTARPYAMLFRDSYEGGIAGSGQFVLDHEVGHLLCLGHWPPGSTSVMRPSIWGGEPASANPRPAMITNDTLQAAQAQRAIGCVGPVEPDMR
jgi:hypothetical protein